MVGVAVTSVDSVVEISEEEEQAEAGDSEAQTCYAIQKRS